MYAYYVTLESPMMSSVTANYPDPVPPIFWKSLRQWCRKSLCLCKTITRHTVRI